MGIYADTVFKKTTLYSKTKANLLVKIAQELTKLIEVSALRRTRQGWFDGHMTNVVIQVPEVGRTHT